MAKSFKAKVKNICVMADYKKKRTKSKSNALLLYIIRAVSCINTALLVVSCLRTVLPFHLTQCTQRTQHLFYRCVLAVATLASDARPLRLLRTLRALRWMESRL